MEEGRRGVGEIVAEGGEGEKGTGEEVDLGLGEVCELSKAGGLPVGREVGVSGVGCATRFVEATAGVQAVRSKAKQPRNDKSSKRLMAGVNPPAR